MVYFIVALSGFLVRTDATSFLRSGQVSTSDADTIFKSEFDGNAGAQRLEQFQNLLRQTYTSLPKNAAGNLGHQAVRYVLHRFFVQQHGWYIRGLEPNNKTQQSDASPTGVKEWVPSYLQDLLEQRLGDTGATLHDLAVLAASLEDVVHKEAVGRLETAYGVHELRTGSPIDGQSLDEVIRTFFVAYLLQGNFSVANVDEAERKEQIFAKKYTGWEEANTWVGKLSDTVLSTASTPDGTYDFAAATQLATEIGSKYFTFNDLECGSLKSTLRDMEGKKAGRVRLSTFYKKALHSHWHFSEKADYLRVLGALDESDPSQPSVIVPNYLTARTNCLEASNLYAICCRNECEDLMGHIEEKIGTEKADPHRIVELVTNLASDTVSVPRTVPDSLVSRLGQVAEIHNGKVPLHGRLFAQWMHHAYPRECPYPHEVGTTSPQTPDEWMQDTGHEDATASEEEMQKHVASDTCASEAPHDCDQEDDELPWSEAEELLMVASTPIHGSSTAGAVEQLTVDGPAVMATMSQRCAALVGICIAAFLVFDHVKTSSGASKKQDDGSHYGGEKPQANWRNIATLSALAMGAYAMNFFQGTTFVCALCLGLLCLLFRRVADSRLDQAKLKAKSLPY